MFVIFLKLTFISFPKKVCPLQVFLSLEKLLFIENDTKEMTPC